MSTQAQPTYPVLEKRVKVERRAGIVREGKGHGFGGAAVPRPAGPATPGFRHRPRELFQVFAPYHSCETSLFHVQGSCCLLNLLFLCSCQSGAACKMLLLVTNHTEHRLKTVEDLYNFSSASAEIPERDLSKIIIFNRNHILEGFPRFTAWLHL